MQVKCICNKGIGNELTVGKEYDVIERVENCVKVKNDRGYTFGYSSLRFENVPAEPSGKVMTCIDIRDTAGITLGKNYNVEQSVVSECRFKLINDLGVVTHMFKSRFTEPSQPPTHRALWTNPSESSFGCGKQIGGTHYSDLTIQPFEFIDKNNLTFFEGNVVKYLSRYNSKDGNKDIDKAIHYVRESFERLEHFQSRTIGMTAKVYCESNNLPPVVELVLCWILEYPISIEVDLIVNLLQTLRVPNHEPPSINLVSRPTLG